MSDNHPTLLCLVEGDPISKAFAMPVPSTGIIGQFRSIIHLSKPVWFKDLEAEDLTLWRVSIPVVSANKHKPVVMNEIGSPTELDPIDDVSEVFPSQDKLPKKTINVIIQRPPPVPVPTSRSAHARDASRSFTPVRLVAVPNDHIKQELAVILSGVQHHPATTAVDPKDVEASQKERLGPFFKRTLPYGKTPIDIKLVMLGLELDKQAKASDGKTTLRSIVEGDIGKLGHSVIAMVAPSGSGKTATVIDLATKHFVVYCKPLTLRSSGTQILPTLAFDVEAMYATAARTPGIAHDLLEIESETHRLVGERVELEFLARLHFLQLLLDRHPDPEPQQFFREQTTAAGTSTIRELVKVLKEYDSLAIQYMLDDIQTKLHAYLDPRCRGLAIALDEAQAAATSILAGKFISPSALAAYWNTRNPPSVLFDKDEIRRHHRRGFLTPLSATLSRMQATLVILGTAISLQDVDREYTSVGEDNNFIRTTDFPLFDEDDG
ncbi:hypothetical protein BGZ88_010967 [Linnemannia elongata]|nr:hypothetical protein BGZ88_010967 [Linnemannia elongata]